MNDNHLYTNTQHDAPQHVITYPAILDGIEALLSEGLQYVSDTSSDYAIARERYSDVELVVEVTSDWRHQFTLFAGREVRQTTDTTHAAHMIHHATVLWQQ